MSTTVRITQEDTRRLVKRAAKLRDRLTQEQERLLDEESEDDGRHSGGIVLAAYDPNRLLEAFPSLRLRPGFKLASYQYIAGLNGNGCAFVTPEDRELPEPLPLNTSANLWPWAEPEDPEYAQAQALLEWASPDVMRFVIGDGSPASFFEASILAREVSELGAIWHGSSWAARTVMTGRKGFPQADWAPPLDDEAWTWHGKRPKLWSPTITLHAQPDAPPTVRFYTFSGLGIEHIVELKDVFRNPTGNPESGPYVFETEKTLLAEGREGYVY